MHLRIARQTDVPAAHGARVRLEDKPIGAIVKADIEALSEARRPHGIVGTNRLLARVRHLFNWAIGEGYLDATPFKRSTAVVVRLDTKAEQARSRRLRPGEEEALLQHAGSHLRALIVAALVTGCRLGELLSLQWSQVRHDAEGQARWIDLPGTKTKTHEARSLSVGTGLRAELEMRRTTPDGRMHPPTAYVFGNECGEPIGSIKTAWITCVLLAHGHTPERGKGTLSAASRASYQTIDLHFHDLRREFACRLLESGASLHDVSLALGHKNITTTSTYLRSIPVRLVPAFARM